VILYLDTSAFVKIYIDEPNAGAIRSAAENSEMLATSIVAYAEMRSAFARRHRSGDLSTDDIDRIKSKFEQDWLEVEALLLDNRTVRRAGEFAESYGLRGFDAVHVASAEALRDVFGPITFACFDADLSRAAGSCGMMLLPSS
jgi:predicted nucleic acid-binding protein